MLQFINDVMTQYNIVHPDATGCQHSYEYVSYCLDTGKVWDEVNSK